MRCHASKLERKFELLWLACEGPALTPEHRFHPSRKWAFDFAHLPSKTAFEVEGGIWAGGRHNRATGFLADCEKYLEATLLGWRVLRLSDNQLTVPVIERIIEFLQIAIDMNPPKRDKDAS